VVFDEVISKIIQSAADLNTRPNQITISKIGEFGAIQSLIATPLALVITELIHNALEHGLSEIGDTVNVCVTKSDLSMTVSVIDNGVGIPDGFSLEKNTNLGLQIVQTLTVNELAGSIEFLKPNKGTEVKLILPLDRN
jgi:two-component sensor histidine kinase